MIFQKFCSIVFHNERIDYQQMRKEIDSLKRRILFEKISADEIVGLAMKRTPLMLETMVAFFELGITFLPLDISLPEKRMQYMLENANIQKIFTTSDISPNFPCAVNFVLVDKADCGDEALNVTETASALAYVLYTSGTTGNPKAVMVTRKGFKNFMDAIPQVVEGFDEKGVIACFTQYTFDIFFLESILALYCGMTVVLADEVEMANPAHIASLIRRHNIGMLQMTPSRLRLLQLHDRTFSSLDEMKVLMVGGERFPEEMLTELNRKNGLKIYNMYGPTETTIWSTVGELTGRTEVDIGKPIANTQIYILDEKLSEVNNGVAGEICIAGDGLAMGYINNLQQTQKSFCIDAQGRQIYRTGDMGYYDNDGILYCAGRIDNQIKLYGHRIEIEDVEQNIISAANLNIAAVAFDKEKNRLVCFYSEELTAEEVRNFAASALPDYMVPAVFVKVDTFLYTSSGKMDRKAMLSAYEQSNSAQISEITGDTENSTLAELVTIITEKGLVCGSVDTKASISDLGISSLDFIDLVVSFEEKYEIEFEDEYLTTEMFESLEALAVYIETLREGV